MLKDAVSIPGISVTYVLNKSLKMKQPGKSELFGPGQPCFQKCKEFEVEPKPSYENARNCEMIVCNAQ